MTQLVRFGARLAAAVAVLAVMVGPVVAVAYAAGNPIPTDLFDRLGGRNVTDDTIIKLLSLGFYVCWAWFCLPALRQLVGASRARSTRPAVATPSRNSRPAPVPVRPTEATTGPRGALARLARFAVSAAATTLTTVPLTAGAAPHVASTIAAPLVAAQVDTMAAKPATSPDPTTGSNMIAASHRDTPYAVADRLFPPDRVDAARDEIRELNLGRTLPDGAAYRGGSFPAGWDVIIPSTPAPATVEPADTSFAESDAVPSQPAGAEPTAPGRIVADGDSYWSLSEDELLVELGREPSRREVLERTEAAIAYNAPRLGHDDPTMLYVGDIVFVDAATLAAVVDQAADSAPAAALSAGRVAADGDSYWSLSDDELLVELGREPSRREVLERTEAAIAYNAPRLGHDDRTMLYVGDVVFVDAATLTPQAATSVMPPLVIEELPPPALPPVLEPVALPPPPTPAAEPTTAVPAPSPGLVAEPSTVELREENRVPPSAPVTTTVDVRPATDGARPAAVDPSSLPADTDQRSTSSFPLAGTIGAATAAAGIIAVVESRRRRRISLRRPEHGHGAGPPADQVSVELAARALAERSHRDVAAATVSALSVCYRNGTLPASALVQGIVIDDDGTVTVHLDEPVPAVTPFTGSNTVWATGADALPAGDALGSVDQLLRTVVSVGRTDSAEVFVDLESLGAISLGGDPDQVRGLTAGVTDQLLDRDDVEIHCDQPLLDRRSGQLVAAVPLTDGPALLQRLSVDRQPLWDQLARGDLESIIDARLADRPYEQLVPACVVTTTTTPASGLLEVAAGGGRGVAVIAPDDAAVRWRAERGVLVLDHLDLTVTHPLVLDVDSHQQLADLIHAQPGPDDVGLAVVAKAPTPPPGAAAFVERDWGYLVRVLRPEPDVIDTASAVVEFTGERNRNGRRGPELLAFLASRPARRASETEIRDALWWDDITANLHQPRSEQRTVTSLKTVSSLAYRAREPLGKEAAIRRVDGCWQLDERIVTDAELLADRVAYVTATACPDWEVLRAGLALIAGEPFQASRSYSWASASHHLFTVHEAISDLAVWAARLAVDDGRFGDALWACDQALAANPGNEIVIQECFEIEAALGNCDGIRRRFEALTTLLAGLGDEPDPSTLDVYHRYVNRRRTA